MISVNFYLSKLFDYYNKGKSFIGKTFLYKWVPKTAVEISKLLPIFFWADKLASWLMMFIMLRV